MALHAMEEKKSRNNKGPKSGDKDYKSDKRGQWILDMRMRNYRIPTWGYIKAICVFICNLGVFDATTRGEVEAKSNS